MSSSDFPARRTWGIRFPRPRAAISIRLIPVDVWALGALIVLATAIRIITINTQSFWTDEALTAYEAHLPFGAMINTVAHVETTPPLYFVLIWVWAHLFGTSEIALRSVSTMAGIALVPITYLAARELISRWAGVLAAAFVAVNPFLIWYSQEARAYMLLAALSGASFLFFARAWRDPSRRNLTLWAIFSSLAVMTHFFAGFLVAPEAVLLLWVARKRATVVAVGIVGGVQLAMLPIAAADTTHGPQWVAQSSRLHRISRTVLEWGVSILERRGHLPEGLLGGTALVMLVVLLLALGGDRRIARGAALAGAVAAFVFIAPLLLAVVHQDYFLSRNEIPAFVPVATFVAAGCTAPRLRVLGALLAVGLLAMFTAATVYVQTHPSLERPDWRKVARALGPATVARAVLAADGSTADPLKIYMPGVSWVEQRNRRVLIGEIDVVGATKRLAVIDRADPGTLASLAEPPARGRSVPRSVSPPGARLISRFRVNNWVVARFVLRRPEQLSISRLAALAPKYFRQTPAALLVFTQRPVQRPLSGVRGAASPSRAGANLTMTSR